MDGKALQAVAILALSGLALIGCATDGRPSAHEIALRWEVLDNLRETRGTFRSRLTLTNHSGSTLGNQGWALHFDSIHPIVDGADPRIRIDHINGPHFRLSPTAAFTPIEPGHSRELDLDGYGSAIKRTDAPDGFYLVFEDAPEAAEVVTDVTLGAFLRDEQTLRSPDDRVPVPTPASRFEGNKALSTLPAEEVGRIIPSPSRMTTAKGRVKIDRTWRIRHEPGLANEARYLAFVLEVSLGGPLPIETGATPGPRVFLLRSAPRIDLAEGSRHSGDEAYTLTVSQESGIAITGTDASGVFYGIQSLRALWPLESNRGVRESVTLEELTVEDSPRFAYRGMHLDVARQFKPKTFVMKLLELMAFYKLNRFHFHLTDDEGWRIAISGLPELTEVGGRRGHSTEEHQFLLPSYGSGPDPAASSGSGHYTREDLVEILRFARDRHVEVIPEIDLPGHARAAIRAMKSRRHRLEAAGRSSEAREHAIAEPDDRSRYRSVQGWTDNVISVCQESSYRFLERVLDEIVSIYREAEAPLTAIHIGGDEVPHGAWTESPACRSLIVADEDVEGVDDLHAYFVRRASSMIASRGLVTAGWEEIALAGAKGERRPEGQFLVYAWNSIWGWGGEDLAYRLANAGYPVVLSNASNLYFDLAYDKDPDEPGLYWAGFVDTRTTFELAPLDIYKTAGVSPMGHPVDPEELARKARLTPAGAVNILGIQGQLWGELTAEPASAEYMAFPKLLALAERAWSRQPDWERIEGPEERRRSLAVDWNRFANALGQRELPRLDHLAGGVAYRVPPPGAMILDGRLHANVAFPGLTIRYTTDGSEPDSRSPVYHGPVAVAEGAVVRAFDSRGRGSRSSVVSH